MELVTNVELQELVEGYGVLKKVSELIWEAELLAEVEKALDIQDRQELKNCA